MKQLPMIAVAVGLILAAPAALAQPDNGSAANKTAQKSANKAARQDVKQKVRRTTTRKVTRAGRVGHSPVTTKPVTLRKVDVTRYRRVVQAQRRYRIARPWIAPRGYAYRRYSLGQRIPASLLVAGFFLTGVSAYGLESAPYGYVWVREGTDAVLVNRYTGEVIQVQYGLFY